MQQGDWWGVNLRAELIVGVGTVCRRQGTIRTGALLAWLHSMGLRLHGFGFKVTGLRSSAAHLASADSLAWSFNCRRHPPIEGHTHKNCANCLEYALDWRTDLLTSIGERS